jgi:hypothetical protein
MKRQFLLLAALAVCATALTTNASGQTAKTLRADVRFDFQIGDLTYPAGEYQISLQADNILQIRSFGGANKTQFIVASHSDAGNGPTPKLVFQKYGESHFLTQVSRFRRMGLCDSPFPKSTGE